MTKEQLAKRIESIIKDAEQLERTVYHMGCSMESFPDAYGFLSGDAVRRAEWLACRMRHMLYEAPLVRKHEYLPGAAEAQGISFEERDGIFEITLPGIALGHSRKRPSEFLFDSLHFAMSEYLGKYPIPRYRHCVLCYTLVFDRELPGRVCLDINNPDLKLYQDVAAAYLLTDDSPKYIDVFHSTELGDHDAVKMAFMVPDRFLKWLWERQPGCA